LKHFYKVLFAIFFLPLFSLAQSNYKPGYVVTLKGDTLHGFIDYRDWDTNPDHVSFKTNAGDNKSQKLTPEAISFFSVDGLESYQKFEGQITTDITNFNNLSEGRDSSYRIGKVFLKILQKGKRVVLFSYSDNLKTRYYIGENPSSYPVELGYRLYYDIDAATQVKGRTVTEKTYIRQLLILASKYNVITDTLQNIIRDASYSEVDLLEIVSKINGITQAEYIKKYSEHTKINLVASIALNRTNTSPASTSPYYAGGGRAYTSYQPAISFGIDFLTNPNTGKLLFRLEASLAENQYRALYQNQVDPYVGIKASFNEVWISFAPQMIYNFYNAENFKFYAGVGIFFTKFKYSNVYFGGQTQTTQTANFAAQNPYDFNTFDNQILLKAGFRIGKRWGVFGNYLSPVSTTRHGYFQLNKDSEQFGINYYF
jgi:hypothetical protein